MSWLSEGIKKVKKAKVSDISTYATTGMSTDQLKKISIREITGAAGKQRAEERARQQQAPIIAAKEAEIAAKSAELQAGGRKTLSTAGADYLSGVSQTLSEADKRAKQAADVLMSANVDPEFRKYQQDLANQLAAQARGEGPSLAQTQLQQATDRTMAQSLGAIKAGMGSQGALAARTAALAGSSQLASQGAQSATLRLQEQQAAQDALASLSQQARGQDIQGSQLGLNAQIAQAQARQAGIDTMIRSGALKIGAQGQVYGDTAGQATRDLERGLDQEYAAQLRAMGRSESEIAQAVAARNEADRYSRGVGEKVVGAGIDAASTYFAAK